eukprot:1065465-Rhodomonas_salina.1
MRFAGFLDFGTAEQPTRSQHTQHDELLSSSCASLDFGDATSVLTNAKNDIPHRILERLAEAALPA